MKRILGLVLALSLLLTLTACGNAAPTPTDAPTDAAPQQGTEAPGTEAPIEVPNLVQQEWTLVDNENLTFTVTKFQDNEHLGLEMHVYCENKTDKNMMFSMDGVSVCGVMYDPFWAQEVSAGKKSNDIIYFDTFQLEKMGITSIDEISFQLRVFDNDNWMDEPFVDEDFEVYPTGLNEQTVVYPEYQHKNGETVVLDNDKLLFIVEKVDDADSDYYTLHCYLHNRTDEDLLVGWEAVSVNGFMVDPVWAAAVGEGKQLFTQISFATSDLAEQGIEDVAEIEFTLYAYDYDDFEGEYLLEEVLTFQPK